MALNPDAVALPAPPWDVRQLTTLKDIVDRLNTGVLQGNGSPEGVVTADRGVLYRRLDGGAGTCLYVHEGASGTNTGWVAK